MNKNKKRVLAGAGTGVIAAVLVLSGCGKSSHSTTVRHAEGAASAAATSSANVAAKQRVMTQVIDPCKGKGSAAADIACIKAAVPKAERYTVGRCLVREAMADHVYRKGNVAGRTQFEDVDAAKCVPAKVAG